MTKKLLKILSLGLGALLLLLVLATIGIMFFTKNTVGTAISAGVSDALGVGVSLADVKLAPLQGQITFNDLVIDNPDGYENKTFLDLQQATIAIRPKTLLTDTVRIKHVELKGVQVVMEQKGLTSNVQEIVDYINEHSEDQASGKKMVIERLDISDIIVKVKLIPLPGKIDTVPLKLAPIQMNNLGENKALNTAELTSRIILAIAGGILQQAVGILPDDLVKGVGAAIGTTANVGKQIITTGVGAGGAIIKGAGNIGGSLIGGLLPKKKDANTPQE